MYIVMFTCMCIYMFLCRCTCRIITVYWESSLVCCQYSVYTNKQQGVMVYIHLYHCACIQPVLCFIATCFLPTHSRIRIPLNGIPRKLQDGIELINIIMVSIYIYSYYRYVKLSVLAREVRPYIHAGVLPCTAAVKYILLPSLLFLRTQTVNVYSY